MRIINYFLYLCIKDTKDFSVTWVNYERNSILRKMLAIALTINS